MDTKDWQDRYYGRDKKKSFVWAAVKSFFSPLVKMWRLILRR